MDVDHFIIFFLDDFHNGALNHVVHFFGFFILGYGVGRRNLKLIMLSPFIMEFGHLYNFLTGRHTEMAIKIIPAQLLAWVVFVGVGYFLAKNLEKVSTKKK